MHFLCIYVQVNYIFDIKMCENNNINPFLHRLFLDNDIIFYF